MSRSIHENLSRRRFRSKSYVDWDEIEKKRRVKGAIQEERRSATEPELPQPASSVQIRVLDGGGNLYYPASLEDMHSVLSLLPKGSLNGLHSINLQSGKAYVNATENAGELDPIIGRRSVEIVPGVFAPVILGTYDRRSMKISIFAYVRVPGAEVPITDQLFVRFQMLETLVHEVAHHYDRSRRVARGRWRMDDVAKMESFADRLGNRWFREYVRPLIVDRFVSEQLQQNRHQD